MTSTNRHVFAEKAPFNPQLQGIDYVERYVGRKDARGFGSGNIQALFKALEYEQARRGNL